MTSPTKTSSSHPRSYSSTRPARSQTTSIRSLSSSASARRAKVLLAVNIIGRKSGAASRTLDDLAERRLKKPELTMVDRAPDLEKALVALWSDLPMQRFTAHKLRKPSSRMRREARRRDHHRLLRHDLRQDRQGSRGTGEEALIRRSRVECQAAPDGAPGGNERWAASPSRGSRLSKWQSARATKRPIERLQDEMGRRIKAQTILPPASNFPPSCSRHCSRPSVTLRKNKQLTNTQIGISLSPIDLAA